MNLKSRPDVWWSVGLFALFGSIWLYIGTIFAETSWDFTQFYVIAHTPLDRIYDQQVIHATGKRLLASIGIEYYPPYVRPAIGALAVRPLQFTTYWTAFGIWSTMQLASSAHSGWLCGGSECGRKHWRVFACSTPR
jgi:hypothetical protein